MTTFITKANQGAYQTAALNTNGLDLLDQEEVVIAADATINSEKATGIAGSANVSGASILVMGTVLSGGLTNFFFKQAGILAKLGGNQVQIGATGVVFGQSDGILLSDAGGTVGSNFVENRGLVTTASGIGISAKLSDNHLANLGTVEAVRGIVAARWRRATTS
jgi:hypothetical protein